MAAGSFVSNSVLTSSLGSYVQTTSLATANVAYANTASSANISVTQTLTDNTTNIATTAFVQGQGFLSNATLGSYATKVYVGSYVSGALANYVTGSWFYTTLGTYATIASLGSYALTSGGTFTGSVSFQNAGIFIGDYVTGSGNLTLGWSGGYNVSPFYMYAAVVEMGPNSAGVGCSFSATQTAFTLDSTSSFVIAGPSTLASVLANTITANTISVKTLSANTITANSLVTITQSLTDNSTNTATTAFVHGNLGSYALTSSLGSYATTTALGSYALTTSLGSYALTSSLATYATQTYVTNAVANFVSNATLTTSLGSYALTSSLATAHVQSANSATVSNTVNTITSTQVTTALGYTPAVLSNSGVTAGTYGSASYVPVVVVAANGIVTNVTTIAAAGGATVVKANPGSTNVGGVITNFGSVGFFGGTPIAASGGTGTFTFATAFPTACVSITFSLLPSTQYNYGINLYSTSTGGFVVYNPSSQTFYGYIQYHAVGY